MGSSTNARESTTSPTEMQIICNCHGQYILNHQIVNLITTQLKNAADSQIYAHSKSITLSQASNYQTSTKASIAYAETIKLIS